MSDLQTRIAATLREHRLGYSVPEGFHCLSQTCDWCDNDLHFADHVAGVLVNELSLTEEKPGIPVFVEDVPRRPIEDGMIGMEGQFHKHIEWIPHTRYRSPWFGVDCPDCQEEFGIHDRRHAEILADSLRNDLP